MVESGTFPPSYFFFPFCAGFDSVFGAGLLPLDFEPLLVFGGLERETCGVGRNGAERVSP